MNHILTIAEAAERMNVSRQRMHKLIESYELQTQKIQGRLLVMDEDELKKIPKVRKNNSADKKQPAKLDRMNTTIIDLSSLDQLRQLVRDHQEKSSETLTELAIRAGVSRTLVYRVVNGSYDSSPSYEFVCRLCSALGLKIEFKPTSS